MNPGGGSSRIMGCYRLRRVGPVEVIVDFYYFTFGRFTPRIDAKGWQPREWLGSYMDEQHW